MTDTAWIWWAAPLAVALFGVFLLLSGLGHLFRGRPFKGSRGILGGSAFAAIGLAASLVGLNVQTYNRLSLERPLAEVSIAAADSAQKLYNVTITRLDEAGAGIAPQTCQVQGDEFELSSWTMKWKPWANVVGLDSRYKLEQLTNRYYPTSQGFGQPITGCNLANAPGLNAQVPERVRSFLLGMAYDTEYGAGSFQPMADGARFELLATQTGVLLRPKNDAAQNAIDMRPQ